MNFEARNSQKPSLDTARREFEHPMNIAIGKGRVLWGTAIEKDGHAVSAGWVLPGGRRTTNRETAEAVARNINSMSR